MSTRDERVVEALRMRLDIVDSEIEVLEQLPGDATPERQERLQWRRQSRDDLIRALAWAEAQQVRGGNLPRG